LPNFRERLKAAIDKSKYKGSYRALSIEAGLGERTIANLIAKSDLDISRNGPGLFAMSRVADCLDVSLDYLAGRQSSQADGLRNSIMRIAGGARGQLVEEGLAPTPDALQRLYVRSGGLLSAFEPVLQFCDRYELVPPDAGHVSVISVGKESLAAITMGSKDRDALQKALSDVPDPAFREKLVKDHNEAQQRGCLTTVERLDVQMPNRPVRVRMDYIRVLMCVEGQNGNREILAYASLII
jgi:hypothetical protein